MKGSNSLTSHHGESRNSRADKMSGMHKATKKIMIGKSKRIVKDIMNSKRRMFLKNPNNYEKI